MNVCSNLSIHLFQQVEHIADNLEQVHAFRANPILRRFQALSLAGHTLTNTLNPLLHITAHRGVVLLPHYQVQIPTGRLVQIIYRRQARGSARQQLEPAQRLDLFHTAHRLCRMVINRPRVALELLAVL